MRRVYWLQIVDDNGIVARFPAGGELERDLVESIVARLDHASVGLMVPKSKVLSAVEQAIIDAIGELKADSRYTESVTKRHG